MAQPTNDPQPYALGAPLYRRADWVGVIPVTGKWPPPTGWTGAEGMWPSGADIYEWCQERGGDNIALRLPPNVLGVDVDAYTDKRGATTLLECEERWGPLPGTWRSTSRDDGVSGIRLFRIPEGLAWPGQLPGGGVELIRWDHRYCMAWPSLHPEGRTYRWTRDGVTSVAIPTAEELPDLPATWVDGLSRGRYQAEAKAHLGLGGAAEWLTGLSGAGEPPCPRMTWLTRELVGNLAGPGSRHETANTGVLSLIRRAEEGHPGIVQQLKSVGESFVIAVTSDGSRSTRTAWAEWTRAVEGAVAILAPQPRTPSLGDPCVVPCDPPWSWWAPDDRPRHQRPAGKANTTPWQNAGHTEPTSTLPAPEGVEPRLFNERVTWLRADRAARTHLLAEAAPPASEQAQEYRLAEFLAVADEPAIYRVAGLLPVGGRVVLAAQMKTGKTTFIGNLIRSLVDGTPFLGAYTVNPPVGNVVLLDNEMDARTLRRWLRDMAIVNTQAALVVPMIGRVGGFDIRIPEVFTYWVERLKAMECTVLILDCLKPILDVLALDERNETGRITTPLTNLKMAAGISELILVHHMGHNGERSRGDSALRGWPEVEWQLVRMAKDPDKEAPMDAPRFFKAYGRDVDVKETKLVYEPGTRSLSMGSGDREDTTWAEMRARILDLVAGEPGINTRNIERGLGKQKEGLAMKLLGLCERDVLVVKAGPNNSKLYFPGPQFPRSPVSPVVPQGEDGGSSPLPFTGGNHHHHRQQIENELPWGDE